MFRGGASFRQGTVAVGLATSLVISSASLTTSAFAQTPMPEAGDSTRQDPSTAVPKVVERNASGPSARNIQVGVYLNVQPDCSSGTLPSLRMITPPSNGTLSIKRGKVSATNYKQCLALEVPGFIAFYQSKADFVGRDEVKYPAGRMEVQRIKINVGGSAGEVPALPKTPQGQKI